MLMFRNGRFHARGVSFAIPDGFKIDPTPALGCPTGLTMYSPDESVQVDLYILKRRYKTDTELRRMLKMENGRYNTIIKDISPVQMFGFQGHDAIYANNVATSYEAWLDSQTGAYVSILMSVKTKRGKENDILSKAQEIIPKFHIQAHSTEK